MAAVKTLKQLRDVIDTMLEEHGDIPVAAAVGSKRPIPRGIDGIGLGFSEFYAMGCPTVAFIVVHGKPDAWDAPSVQVSDPLWFVDTPKAQQYCPRAFPGLTIMLSGESSDSFWLLFLADCRRLAELPLKEMDSFIRDKGTLIRVGATLELADEADICIGPAEFIDAVEEAELRDELRKSSGRQGTGG